MTGWIRFSVLRLDYLTLSRSIRTERHGFTASPLHAETARISTGSRFRFSRRVLGEKHEHGIHQAALRRASKAQARVRYRPERGKPCEGRITGTSGPHLMIRLEMAGIGLSHSIRFGTWTTWTPNAKAKGAGDRPMSRQQRLVGSIC